MVPTDNDIWLIDSGASKHMTRYKDHLTDLVEKETNLKRPIYMLSLETMPDIM